MDLGFLSRTSGFLLFRYLKRFNQLLRILGTFGEIARAFWSFEPNCSGHFGSVLQDFGCGEMGWPSAQ